MSNYKCTPTSTNTSDTTEYLGTITNLASTILQSTKKVKVLDSLIYWGSLHFVDKNRNPAKSKNIMTTYRCIPFIPILFLWFLQWQKRSMLPLQLQCVSKTENRGIQKLTLPKWQNSKSSELLNISFTNGLCWLRYNQR